MAGDMGGAGGCDTTDVGLQEGSVDFDGRD